MPSEENPRIGERIRRRREEAGLSLSALAAKADISKGYLWSLEKGETQARPSGRTLYAIADALGTTMSDLLGRQLLVEASSEVPDSLREFAEAEGLTDTDVQMLSGINFRGQRPADRQSWLLVWSAIRASVRG